MVVSEIEFKNALVEMNAEEKQKKLAEVRQEQIDYEWTLYKHFCALWGYKIYFPSSLQEFMDYCLESGIELVK